MLFHTDFFSCQWNNSTSSVNRTSDTQAGLSCPADVLLAIMILLAVGVWMGHDLIAR
jgi:hypothetical protein